MTAEVAILNRESVAMATDSAVSISDAHGQKVFSSANKIFALTKHAPIGIMIYGSAGFMQVPWETIVKIYRKELSTDRFDTVKKYGDDFIDFIEKRMQLIPENIQKEYATFMINSYFDIIRRHILDTIRSKFEESEKQLDNEDISNIISPIIKYHRDVWKGGSPINDNISSRKASIKQKFSNSIKDIKKRVFEKLPINASQSRMLGDIASYLFLTFPDGVVQTGTSGVVIAGFGEKEYFPALYSFEVEGLLDNLLKYRIVHNHSISFDQPSLIIPFAQKEMVQSFIEGVNPNYQSELNDLLIKTITKYPKIIIDSFRDKQIEKKDSLIKRLEQLSKEEISNNLAKLDEYRNKYFVNPILSVITVLPKDELAALAEALVNLTCLKKKITMEEETVGGPIDVAVISKGDGLIWMKRKHYFKAELNQHYINNLFNTN